MSWDFLHRAPYEQGKTVSQRYSIAKFENRMFASCWLHGHEYFPLVKGFLIFWNFCYWVCKHTQVPFFHLFVPLKGQCQEILEKKKIWLKRFDLGPIQTDKNSFANFFVFAKIFDRKVRKSCNFFFRYGGFHIFKLLLLGV